MPSKPDSECEEHPAKDGGETQRAVRRENEESVALSHFRRKQNCTSHGLARSLAGLLDQRHRDKGPSRPRPWYIVIQFFTACRLLVIEPVLVHLHRLPAFLCF
jgi:hypothetical protein